MWLISKFDFVSFHHTHSYGHFSDDGCPLFRDEDYLPPQDLEPSEVTAPDDIKVLEETLFSACPRCAKVRNI